MQRIQVTKLFIRREADARRSFGACSEVWYALARKGILRGQFWRQPAMLIIDLPPTLQMRLNTVIEDSYHGDVQAAVAAFLQLHE